MHTQMTRDADLGPTISSRFELKGPCDGSCGSIEIDIGPELEKKLSKANA